MPGCDNHYRDPTPRGLNWQDSTYPRSFDTFFKMKLMFVDAAGVGNTKQTLVDAGTKMHGMHQNEIHGFRSKSVGLWMCPTANLCPWWKGAEFPFHFCTRQCNQNWFAWFAPRLKRTRCFAKNSIWTQPVNSLRKHFIVSLESKQNTNSKASRTAEVPGMMKRYQFWPNSTNTCDNRRATRIWIGPAVALKILAVKQFAKLVYKFALASRWCGRKVVHPMKQYLAPKRKQRL